MFLSLGCCHRNRGGVGRLREFTEGRSVGCSNSICLVSLLAMEAENERPQQKVYRARAGSGGLELEEW